MAFALIAGAMIDRTNATQQMNLQIGTRDQLSRLSYAITQYAVEHGNRYPCPADPQIAYTAASFGSAINACESALSGGVVALTNNVMIRGMVPVRSLLTYGITANDAFDGWNNRIMYVVDRQMTAAGSGSPGAAANRLTITDAITSVTFKDPDFLLISYGKDGLNATPKTATAVAIACGAAGQIRRINCDTDLTYTLRPLYVGPAATATTYYDDIVSFYNQ